MAKKSSISLYLIGMAVAVIGCFLPMTASKVFGGGSTVFDAVTSGSSGSVAIGAILAMAGAVAGVVFSFISVKGVPVKLISLIVSVAGGIYVAICYLNLGGLGKSLIKLGAKVTQTGPGIGLFVIVIGWLIAVIGYMKNRD